MARIRNAAAFHIERHAPLRFAPIVEGGDLRSRHSPAWKRFVEKPDRRAILVGGQDLEAPQGVAPIRLCFHPAGYVRIENAHSLLVFPNLDHRAIVVTNRDKSYFPGARASSARALLVSDFSNPIMSFNPAAQSRARCQEAAGHASSKPTSGSPEWIRTGVNAVYAARADDEMKRTRSK